MPRISLFLGISIYMYYDDHNPPHFHAIYNDYGAMIDIKNMKIISGELPNKVFILVSEWGKLYHEELMLNWKLAKDGQLIKSINPLI